MASAHHPFPRASRLLRPVQFAAVMKNGKHRQSQYFNFRYLANGLDHPRLGVTISRKTAPNAVDRNRIRRQIRESFRLDRAACQAVDVVVSASARAVATARAQLRRDLAAQWRRLT